MHEQRSHTVLAVCGVSEVKKKKSKGQDFFSTDELRKNSGRISVSGVLPWLYPATAFIKKVI